MEGQTRPTNKLRFVESKRKIRVEGQIGEPHQKLITAANKHDLTLIGLGDNSIRFVETSKLFDFASNQPQIINQNLDTLINLTFRPTLLTVARYGYSSTLLICGTSSFPKYPSLEVYDLDTRSTVGRLNLNDLGDSDITDYAWHPCYYDSLVALCTSRGQLLVLAINRQDKGIGIVYKNEQYGALTCCWSMKGKNLAVGTQQGHVFRLEPVVGNNSFSFKEVNGSNLTFENPKITPAHQLVKLRWINQKYLMAVHAVPNKPGEPETVYSVITVKPGKPYSYWTNISFEGQASSNYVVHLANLSNSVVCASSATGEAAVIGVLGANEVATNELNDWGALIVEEEGARIELPLDVNNRETHPCGVTLTTYPQDNRPALIFLTNDGLICPFAVMHSENILKFPEHINQPEQTFTFEVPKPVAPTSSAFGGKASFYQTNLAPAPRFGGTPAFFQTPAFGQSAVTPFGSTNQQAPLSFQAQSPQQPQTLQQSQTPSQPQTPQTQMHTPQQIQTPQPSPLQLQSPQQVQSQNSLSFTQLHLPQTPTQSQPEPQASQTPRLFQTEPPVEIQKPSQPPSATQSPAQPKIQLPSLQPQSVTQEKAQLQIKPPTQTQSRPVSQPQPMQKTIVESPKSEVPESDFRVDDSLITSTAIKIREAREKLEYNEAYITLFEELNHLRDRFDETLDLHKAHREALDAVKEDIDRLDLEVLETFYLIEYVKSRISCDIKKKTIDPVTLKKVNNIKMKLKHIEGKLDELNDHVDVAWEDFVRRRSNKDRRVTSLDMIYKALATNQKVISVLRKKVELEPNKSLPSPTTYSVDKVPSVKPKEGDFSRFEEFLASRSIVPVRKPIHLKE